MGGGLDPGDQIGHACLGPRREPGRLAVEFVLTLAPGKIAGVVGKPAEGLADVVEKPSGQ